MEYRYGHSNKIKWIIAGIIIGLFASVAAAFFLTQNTVKSPQKNPSISSTDTASIKKPKPSTFDKKLHSTTNPSSIWVVVNKTHPLSPIDYTPDDLVVVHGATVRGVVKPDLEAMLAAAKADGVLITVTSSYRSYGYQTALYGNYVSVHGQKATDTFSARPGYSEHQTGLTIDFASSTDPSCNLESCYADVAEGAWLRENAYKYGFLLRYPADKEKITGYMFEPWHYRYIGKELALYMKKQSITTLEEFFDIGGGVEYK